MANGLRGARSMARAGAQWLHTLTDRAEGPGRRRRVAFCRSGAPASRPAVPHLPHFLFSLLVKDGTLAYASWVTETDVRWQQRLQSYSRAVSSLEEALERGPDVLNTLEKEGTVQRFEFTLELAWNLLKDFLQASGVELSSVTPKSVVKAAFAARLIAGGQTWIDMLQWRNALSHRYDEALLELGIVKIYKEFLPAFLALRERFTEQTNDDP